MRLAVAGLPVPPGFVLPTAWCRKHRTPQTNEAAQNSVLSEGIAQLEAATGLGFGSPRKPLLVSVRSGAAISMPGMMETVLDVGVNDETVGGLMRLTGNPRLAWDSYRRLIQGVAEVVQGLPTEPFDALTREALAVEGVENERMLDHRALQRLVRVMLARFRELAGRPFPQSPADQLEQATNAVFRSWDASKAAEYRRLNHIDDNIGTAVTVQTMVFGNAGGTSGAGVGFTRNPATGENKLYLDFQFNGQGEDVVAGRLAIRDTDRLQSTLAAVWEQLEKVRRQLEAMFTDVQDFEFTIQNRQLYLLQTRTAKRTPWAALKIACDLVEEGLVQPTEALSRLEAVDLESVVWKPLVRNPKRTTGPRNDRRNRCRRRADRAGSRGSQTLRRQWRPGNSGTTGNDNCRHHGNGECCRNTHRARWTDFACGGRCKATRKGLSGRLRRTSCGSRPPHLPNCRAELRGRRLAHA